MSPNTLTLPDQFTNEKMPPTPHTISIIPPITIYDEEKALLTQEELPSTTIHDEEKALLTQEQSPSRSSSYCATYETRRRLFHTLFWLLLLSHLLVFPTIHLSKADSPASPRARAVALSFFFSLSGCELVVFVVLMVLKSREQDCEVCHGRGIAWD
jgi:hypothetical protein